MNNLFIKLKIINDLSKIILSYLTKSHNNLLSNKLGNINTEEIIKYDSRLMVNIKDKINQVLILRFIELMKRREISDILHYSLSYIDRLLKRGLFFIDEKLKSSSQKVVI